MAINTTSTYSPGMVTVKVEGLENVIARLNMMRQDLQRRLLVDVMKKSLKTTLAVAQSNTPVGIGRRGRSQLASGETQKRSAGLMAGILRRSYRIKKVRSDNPFVLEVQLQNTAYYAGWVEYGHKLVRGKKGARRVVGHVPATPFLRTTFETQKNTIVDQVAQGIDQALMRRGF